MGPVRTQVSEWELKQGLFVVSPNARVAADGGLGITIPQSLLQRADEVIQ